MTQQFSHIHALQIRLIFSISFSSTSFPWSFRSFSRILLPPSRNSILADMSNAGPSYSNAESTAPPFGYAPVSPISPPPPPPPPGAPSNYRPYAPNNNEFEAAPTYDRDGYYSAKPVLTDYTQESATSVAETEPPTQDFPPTKPVSQKVIDEEDPIADGYDEEALDKPVGPHVLFVYLLLGLIAGGITGPIAYFLLSFQKPLRIIGRRRLCFVWGVVVGLYITIAVLIGLWYVFWK